MHPRHCRLSTSITELLTCRSNQFHSQIPFSGSNITVHLDILAGNLEGILNSPHPSPTSAGVRSSSLPLLPRNSPSNSTLYLLSPPSKRVVVKGPELRRARHLWPRRECEERCTRSRASPSIPHWRPLHGPPVSHLQTFPKK